MWRITPTIVLWQSIDSRQNSLHEAALPLRAMALVSHTRP
jgi:hypothetical protein